MRPNIIFIVLDTLRADKVLEVYKNKLLMPFVNKLLDNSYYFKDCSAPSPWTLPSHISMFTGLTSTENAVISEKINKLSMKIPVLAEILQNNGYNTICYTENPYISKKYGLLRGFEKIFKNWKYGGRWWWWLDKKDKISRFIKYLKKIDKFLKNIINLKIALIFWDKIRFHIERSLRYIEKELFWKNYLINYNNKTIQNLEKFKNDLTSIKNNKSNFLFFNIMTTHDPHIPFKETYDLFNITIKDFKILKDFFLTPKKYFIKINMQKKNLSQEQIKALDKFYNACVYSTDLVIKHIFSILKELNLLDNSYVFITSDHGEHLCSKKDHYLWGHQNCLSLYKSVINVPFMIYNPNFKRRMINSQIQLKDIFHTILHASGLSESDTKYINLDKSILNQIKNNSTPKLIFGEHLKSLTFTTKLINNYRKKIKKKLLPKISDHIFYLKSEKYKYVKYNRTNNSEFYNLEKDPYELQNIYSKEKDKCREMGKLLKKKLKNLKNPNNLKQLTTNKEKEILEKALKKIELKF